MIVTVTTGLTIVFFALSLVLIQRSRRHSRYQEKLGAAFDRAQQLRMQRPRGLYGDRAWSTSCSRSHGSQLTLLRLR